MGSATAALECRETDVSWREYAKPGALAYFLPVLQELQIQPLPHQDGCHDDCVFALDLAAIGMRFAPKPQMVEVFGTRRRRPRFGKIGDKLRRDDDDWEDEQDHKRPFKAWR